jgi:hypothetical protein
MSRRMLSPHSGSSRRETKAEGEEEDLSLSVDDLLMEKQGHIDHSAQQIPDDNTNTDNNTNTSNCQGPQPSKSKSKSSTVGFSTVKGE